MSTRLTTELGEFIITEDGNFIILDERGTGEPLGTQFLVNWNIHDLPVLSFTLNNIYSALHQNLTGTIDDTVLPSVADPSQQKSSFAPWLNGSSWYVWDNDLKGYRPAVVFADKVKLDASPTANRIQTLQNKSGTVALLDDAYSVRDTVILPEGLVSVDWDRGIRFKCALSGNRQSAFYMTHSKPGMKIKLQVINKGTSQTVGTWDPLIKWPANTAPTMPAAKPGTSSSIIIGLENINGTIYGDSSAYEHTT